MRKPPFKEGMKEVMVFGTFDVLHEGHRNFLKQARALGDWLVVALASDANIEFLKNHKPKQPYYERLEALLGLDDVSQVVEGDNVAYVDEEYGSTFGHWGVIGEQRPNIIALGYDQLHLKELIEKHLGTRSDPPSIVVLEPFQPEKYKSSLLNS